MRVEVYWNIRKGLWSIRALEGPNKGRVIDRRPRVWLKDCEMVVQPAGRARVRREGKKNVHAFVRGTLYGHKAITEIAEKLYEGYGPMGDTFSYNPYHHETFVTEDGTPIHKATSVLLVWAMSHDAETAPFPVPVCKIKPLCRAWGTQLTLDV